MKKSIALIIAMAFISLYIKAQPERVEPFSDAVPYSLKSPSNLYLTNQDASAVKNFFETQSAIKPDNIIIVDDGYYHGFRICYNAPECADKEKSQAWIQVLTINTEECIDWFEKTNPEFLMVPFQGMTENTGNKKHLKKDYKKIYEQYKYLACRLYRLTEGHDGYETGELSLVVDKYSERINLHTDQMLVSGDRNVFVRPRNDISDSQSLWIQCLEELDLVGYITLIEYSDPPGSDMFR